MDCFPDPPSKKLSVKSSLEAPSARFTSDHRYQARIYQQKPIAQIKDLTHLRLPS